MCNIQFDKKMKSLLLILLFPLATYALPKVSVSCFLLGSLGCETKCSLKCLLLGCVSMKSTCDGWSHCACHEVYTVGDSTITFYDFENLEFVELWNRIFEANDASARMLERIKKDDDLEVFLINLLRDPYMTGDDIISILKKKYPTWKAVNSMVSLQHGWKTEIMESGKHIQYDELDANMDKLLDLINTVPPDDLSNSKYKIRVKNLLKTITKIEDLEEILYLVRLSGSQNLYQLIKTSLRNLGYGFQEDGDKPVGKKAILQSISIDLDDADDDEKLEVAIAKKFMQQGANSNSSARRNSLNVIDIDVPNPVPTPPAQVQYGQINYFPWKVNVVPTASNNGNGNSYWSSIGYSGSENLALGNEGYENLISNGSQQVYSNTQGSKRIILVVDANGNVVQASEMASNV